MVMTYFTYHPGQMTPGSTIFDDADTLFPRFILVGLPTGITGLIVVAIMAAAMSSLSSGLNSSSAVIQEDVLNRVKKRKEKNTSSELKEIKRTSALLGLAVSCSCFFVSYVTGNLFDVIVKVVNLVVAPLFVLFFMALFIPFATNRSTVIAGLASLLTAVLIAFFEIGNIKVLWIMPAALSVGIAVGVLLSYLETRLLTKK
jgi:Na+/proline symporter